MIKQLRSQQIWMSVALHTTDALRKSAVIMEKVFLLVYVEKGTYMILTALPAKVSVIDSPTSLGTEISIPILADPN